MTKKEIGNYLFIMSFGICLFRLAIANTTFSSYIPTSGIFLFLSFLISIIFITIKILVCDRIYLKHVFVYMSLIAISILIYRHSGYSDIVFLSILLMGANGVDLRTIIKTHFYIYLLVMAMALVCSLLGIIDNYIVYSSLHGIRYSLGNTYPTDFSAGIFYLLVDYIFLKYKKWRVKDFIITITITVVVFYYTKASMDFYLSIILITAIQMKNSVLFSKHKIKILLKNMIYFLSIIAYPVLCIFSIVCTMNFKQSNTIYTYINYLFDNRLAYGKLAIEKYGFSLFGNSVQFYGNGWNTQSDSYFYVDNGFIYILTVYGIVLLTLICISFTIASIKLRKKYIIINFLLIIIALSTLGEPRFINYLYNPLLFVISDFILFGKNSVSLKSHDK
ncbi:hypothetical protein LB941_11990 [Ligilactobacillus sp. WILCCON 0076]|uniref:Polysaccharide polymerase n=1 Tax=Ligilactobacillus ubinensis TaxID=2876789 RepID=A0A9X2FMU5_9LACO|nr:hypothetical protein [Ligilactobacillus ubinensis]MCP0888050.1 hypothetical protein [Ligilactobacillus ubinensis]